jgi:hypothetical protein
MINVKEMEKNIQTLDIFLEGIIFIYAATKLFHENQGGVFMKILRTEGFDVHHFQGRNGFSITVPTRKRRSNEFEKILEEIMNEPNEDLEEFRVLLPTNGHFWDNGYEDKE